MHWLVCGPVHKGTNHVPKAVSDRDPLPGPRFRKGLRLIATLCETGPWLGSWFELRAVTSIANAVPITNRICALRGNILLRISKMHTHESRSERALRSRVSESGFLRWSRSKTPFISRFKTLISKTFAFTMGKIRLSNQARVRITFRNGFRNVIRSFVNRPSVPHYHDGESLTINLINQYT